MMDIGAAVVVVATFYFIIRGAEVRLALLAGGAVLTLAAWKPEAWFTAFSGSMVQAGLLIVILPAIGFTAVVKLAKCDQHLVRLAVGPLLALRAVVIPAAMLVTLALSTAITSAAGITAAVGVVLIPAIPHEVRSPTVKQPQFGTPGGNLKEAVGGDRHTPGTRRMAAATTRARTAISNGFWM